MRRSDAGPEDSHQPTYRNDRILAYHGKHLAPGSRHHVIKAIAISTAAVLAVLAGTAFLTYRHLEGNISVSDAFEQITAAAPRVGRDRRARTSRSTS